ncbi:Berberine bridge enzyme-like 17 [Vigna angularis]|uniref:Berberine bridge enzyme-like 17 n=1 Tax=Phaseolus angularis TaxID=3914 RepID=A0A8T0LHX9_PHAAN|nr:Berberine bridge enzyme-like 17 [Vigna angularis]
MLPVSLGNSQNQSPDIKQFLSCLSAHSSKTIPEAVYTPQNASYTSILNLHVQNKRYKTKNTPKPLAIITAKSENHVQATVTCAKSSRIQIRIRSGGHDYEAASYVSDVPFVILDMFPLQSVDVDVKKDGTDVAYKWQLVAPKLDRDLFIRVEPNAVNGTVIISFIGMFLGPIEKLVPMVSKSFPELGLKKSDCIAMPWVNSTLFWYDSPIGTPIQALLPTSQEPSTIYFKSRSDYVKTPIPKTALKGVWDLMIKCNNCAELNKDGDMTTDHYVVSLSEIDNKDGKEWLDNGIGFEGDHGAWCC